MLVWPRLVCLLNFHCFFYLGVVVFVDRVNANTGSRVVRINLVPLTMDDWTTVLAFSAPILLVDEILKAIGRRINQQN